MSAATARGARRDRRFAHVSTFVVLLTGPPNAGKTATLTALSDALVDDGTALAAVDVDEVAWGYAPGPSARGGRAAGPDLPALNGVHLVDTDASSRSRWQSGSAQLCRRRRAQVGRSETKATRTAVSASSRLAPVVEASTAYSRAAARSFGGGAGWDGGPAMTVP